jgi:hypothetical protein
MLGVFFFPGAAEPTLRASGTMVPALTVKEDMGPLRASLAD